METVNYTAKLPVYREADVIVAGAGPAGIAAAISAARGGAKVFLFDQWGAVGGMATVGLVGPFMSSFDAAGEHQIIRGIFDEMVQNMCAVGGAIHPLTIRQENSYSGYFKLGHDHVGPFDHEAFKRVATEMLEDAGVELLLHTGLADVLVEERQIIGVVLSNKAGLSVVRGKIMIDCTGDGDVAARADADYVLGSEQDGRMQPATLFFRVCNVDTAKLDEEIARHADEIRPFYGPLSWLVRERADEWKGIPRGEVCLFESPNKGEFRLNVTRVLNVDATDPEDMTKAEIAGMRQAQQAFAFLKKYAPGFEHAIFMGTASAIGIRESRHIKGVKQITGDDVIQCRIPPDTIAVMATNMDTHNEDDEGGTFYTIKNGAGYGVPYGCLVAAGISNLMMAGRCISADAMAASSIRMIPCCIAFGQAAGTAAALAVQKNQTPAEVDIGQLRTLLAAQNVYLGEEI